MGGAALVGGLAGNAMQGGVNSGPAYSGADGQQSTGTGDKNFKCRTRLGAVIVRHGVVDRDGGG